jgi:hypothetical protein
MKSALSFWLKQKHTIDYPMILLTGITDYLFRLGLALTTRPVRSSQPPKANVKEQRNNETKAMRKLIGVYPMLNSHPTVIYYIPT